MCVCGEKISKKQALSKMVYIPQKRQIMWTHEAETGTTKPNTRGIFHPNAKPVLDLMPVSDWD